MSISIAQARSLLLGEYVKINESRSRADVLLNYEDKAASSSTNRISIKEARALLTEI